MLTAGAISYSARNRMPGIITWRRPVL